MLNSEEDRVDVKEKEMTKKKRRVTGKKKKRTGVRRIKPKFPRRKTRKRKKKQGLWMKRKNLVYIWTLMLYQMLLKEEEMNPYFCLKRLRTKAGIVAHQPMQSVN